MMKTKLTAPHHGWPWTILTWLLPIRIFSLLEMSFRNMHINFAQPILKKQFLELSGLHSTLLIPRYSIASSPALQILHCRGTTGESWHQSDALLGKWRCMTHCIHRLTSDIEPHFKPVWIQYPSQTWAETKVTWCKRLWCLCNCNSKAFSQRWQPNYCYIQPAGH